MTENRTAVWSYLCSVLTAQMTDDQIVNVSTFLRFRGLPEADEAHEALQRLLWEQHEEPAA